MEAGQGRLITSFAQQILILLEFFDLSL